MRRYLVLLVTKPLNLILQAGNFFAQLAKQGFELFTGGLN